jgi:hypothetical protein
MAKNRVILATVGKILNFFYFGGSQKFMYDGPKSMLGIRIPVRWDPDLIGHIRIL